MRAVELDQHLSGIDTQWTLVRKACQGPADLSRSAQEQLLVRYGGAVRRYLTCVLRDGDAADDLFQEFACRLLRGDMHGADPSRGRFRHYVKGVLFHLTADHHRRRQKLPVSLPEGHPGAVAADSVGAAEQEFVACWRADLLARSWSALADLDRQTGKLFYTVLRYRVDHQGVSSTEVAARLSERLGKNLTPTSVRQMLHRAREWFADHLLEEIANTLDNPTPERLHDELGALGLLEYCRSALSRRCWEL